MNIQVEIPDFYLLTLAVHGNMGDGEIPDLMRVWAQRMCKEKGLQQDLESLQNERLRELEQRLRNTIGDEMVEEIHTSIEVVAKALSR